MEASFANAVGEQKSAQKAKASELRHRSATSTASAAAFVFFFSRLVMFFVFSLVFPEISYYTCSSSFRCSSILMRFVHSLAAESCGCSFFIFLYAVCFDESSVLCCRFWCLVPYMMRLFDPTKHPTCRVLRGGSATKEPVLWRRALPRIHNRVRCLMLMAIFVFSLCYCPCVLNPPHVFCGIGSLDLSRYKVLDVVRYWANRAKKNGDIHTYIHIYACGCRRVVFLSYR